MDAVRPPGVRFECSMLQTRASNASGSMRWKDVSCDDPDDFASLWRREASADDLITGDEVLCLPPVRPEQWTGRPVKKCM